MTDPDAITSELVIIGPHRVIVRPLGGNLHLTVINAPPFGHPDRLDLFSAVLPGVVQAAYRRLTGSRRKVETFPGWSGDGFIPGEGQNYRANVCGLPLPDGGRPVLCQAFLYMR